MSRRGLNGDGYRLFTRGGLLGTGVWEVDHPQAPDAERLFRERWAAHAVQVFARVVRAGGAEIRVRVGVARTRA